jgi:fructose-specific component phosphotransferase system IIB-like protein
MDDRHASIAQARTYRLTVVLSHVAVRLAGESWSATPSRAVMVIVLRNGFVCQSYSDGERTPFCAGNSE